MEKDEFNPDIETLKRLIPYFRQSHDWNEGSGVHYVGSTEKIIDNRVNFELSLLRYKTQERLIDALNKSVKSQDRLANIEIVLMIFAIVIAVLQLIRMFVPT